MIKIKNLSQLKKLLVKGTEFEITGHCRPEVIGERYAVNYADTTGIYNIIPSKPDHKVTKANGGKGSYLGWSKSAFWDFREDGICALYSSDTNKTPDTLIIAVRLCDSGTAVTA